MGIGGKRGASGNRRKSRKEAAEIRKDKSDRWRQQKEKGTIGFGKTSDQVRKLGSSCMHMYF